MPKRLAACLVTTLMVGLAAGGNAQSEALSETMLDFHDRLRAARDALVFPDLETFQGLMGSLSLSQSALGKLPAAQQRHVQKVRQLAASAETATDLSSAAKLMSKVTQECGGCHRDTKGGPAFPHAPLPEEARNSRQHMDRYRWALERMWEGLATSQPKSWRAGAAELREDTLALDTLPESARTEAGKKLTRELHALGKQAQKAKSGSERARMLSSIVQKCGQCHADSGVTEASGAE